MYEFKNEAYLHDTFISRQQLVSYQLVTMLQIYETAHSCYSVKLLLLSKTK